MMFIRLRRAASVFALTTAYSLLPLTDLSAASHSKSGGERREGIERISRQGSSVWKVLMSLWEQAGMRIDDNG